MTIACDVKTILTCVLSIKESLGDVATSDAICDKLDNLEEKLCGPCIVPLAEPMTAATSAIVKGDATSQFSPGSDFEQVDAIGVVIGTAQVTNAIYNAATDTTTVQLASNTVAAAQLSLVKGAKRKFTPSFARTKEPVKEKEAEVVAPRTAGA